MGEIDEAELVDAGQRGAVIDGMADGRKRTVLADVLRACCHELKDQIDPRGLRLTNVNVTGGLDLTGLADGSTSAAPRWAAWAPTARGCTIPAATRSASIRPG